MQLGKKAGYDLIYSCPNSKMSYDFEFPTMRLALKIPAQILSDMVRIPRSEGFMDLLHCRAFNGI